MPVFLRIQKVAMIEAVAQYCPDATIGAAVKEALTYLIAKDLSLLRNDVAERTIAAALMAHLGRVFPEWNVDVEYNRMGEAAKRVAWNEDRALVYPDVIVHIRDSSRNLLAIELKKSSNQEDKQDDVRKLRAYRTDGDLAYQHCLFLRIGTQEQAGLITEFEWV
jgi:hypothetical protein